MHVHQFWWAWHFQFRRYYYFKNSQNSLSDHGLWVSKNLIDWNWLKKFMHVGVDVKCMYANFGGCGISSFGDIATSKTAKIPFLTMDYSPWVSKNLIDRNWLKKFMHVGVDVKCMYTNFGWRSFCSFEDMATFQKRPNFPFGAWTIVRS